MLQVQFSLCTLTPPPIILLSLYGCLKALLHNLIKEDLSWQVLQA